MEDVNKYLPKKGEKWDKKWRRGHKKRWTPGWRIEDVNKFFVAGLRRMTRVGGPQMELDTLLNCD